MLSFVSPDSSWVEIRAGNLKSQKCWHPRVNVTGQSLGDLPCSYGLTVPFDEYVR
jgi:hypothetical protein